MLMDGHYEQLEKVESFHPSLSEVIHLDHVCMQDPWSEQLWVQYARKDEIRVIKQSQIIVGFLLATTLVDEVELLKIAISPPARGQGLGYQLLSRFIQELQLQTKSRLLLEVSAHNQPAIRLYQSLGFQQDGLRKNYYKTSDKSVFHDALLMSLSLFSN